MSDLENDHAATGILTLDQPVVADRESDAVSPVPQPAAQDPQTDAPELTLSFGQVVLLTVAFGLTSGTLEGVYWIVQRYAFGELTFRGASMFWMAPLLQSVLFLAMAFPLLALSIRRKVSYSIVIAMLVFLTTMNTLGLFHQLHFAARLILSLGFGIQMARWIPRSPGRLHRLAFATIAANVGFVAVVAGIVESAQGRWSPSVPLADAVPESPNVLLIVLDTVRADAWQETQRGIAMPKMRALAEEGVYFRSAQATAPWTLPSHASLFTGKFPHQMASGWTTGLGRRWPTLASVLRDHGYTTAGFVANRWYCSFETGLGRGFHKYDDYSISWATWIGSTAFGRKLCDLPPVRNWFTGSPLDHVGRRDADDLNALFLNWADRQGDRPFFAYLNYFDAHDPYVPRDGFAQAAPQSDHAREVIGNWWNLDKLAVTAADRELIEQNYFDCMRYLDDRVSKLMESLEQRGVLENTVLIVVSDHGEHFGDHDIYGHGNSLYQAALHVPLLVHWPGHVPANVQVDEYVSLRQIPATVLELLGENGLSMEENPFEGPALLQEGAMGCHFDPRTGPVPFSEISMRSQFPCCQGRSPVFRGPMKSLIRDGFKYVRTGLQEELYFLTDDPEELHDLSSSNEHQVVLDAMRQAVVELVQTHQ